MNLRRTSYKKHIQGVKQSFENFMISCQGYHGLAKQTRTDFDVILHPTHEREAGNHGLTKQ